jgi:2-oxoglutarate ferredoxin oxidoreductase subunit beta
MIEEANKNGEILTGVYYVDTTKPNFLDMLSIDAAPLATLPESRVRPPREALDEAMEELR